MENNFWQANFWGIIGTVSGTLGLFISWLSWRYSKPKIEIAKLKLITPYFSHIKDYKQKNKQGGYYADFILHIRLRNKKGGPGSIEKPVLILRYKIGNSLFIPRFREYKLNPRTKHTEWKKLSENSSEGTVVRHGEAWNFTGGQIVDDELEYIFREADFYDFVQNWEKVEYFIEYHDNFGKSYRSKVTQVAEKY